MLSKPSNEKPFPTEILPTIFEAFYPRIKSVASQEASFKTFFDELDEKAANIIYLNGGKERDALKGQNCLIIGEFHKSLLSYRL